MKRSVISVMLMAIFAAYSVSAQASYLEFGTKAANGKEQITHVIAVGRPTALGELPLGAAIAKGQQIRAVFPSHAVKFLVATSGPTCDVKHTGLLAFIRKEFTNVACRPASLNRNALVTEMLGLQNIASFDFFGHSSIRYGLHLGVSPTKNNSEDWRPFDRPGELPAGHRGSAELREHFIPGAYAVLHGCNGGHLMAKWLSDVWGIPVAGALTYSHIEQYWKSPEEEGQRYFEPIAIPALKATAPDLSSDVSQLIRTRMKADTVVYSSEEGFGTYLQGLPIFKFFCEKGLEEQCMLGIARSVLTTVTPVKSSGGGNARQHYESIVREFMCPTDRISRSSNKAFFVAKRKNGLSATQCSELLLKLTSAYRTHQEKGVPAPFSNSSSKYMPFEGNSVQCDGLNACYEKPCYQNVQAPLAGRPELMAVFCAKGVALPGSKLPARALGNLTPTSGSGASLSGASTFVDEYLLVINAFGALSEVDLEHFAN